MEKSCTLGKESVRKEKVGGGGWVGWVGLGFASLCALSFWEQPFHILFGITCPMRSWLFDVSLFPVSVFLVMLLLNSFIGRSFCCSLAGYVSLAACIVGCLFL